MKLLAFTKIFPTFILYSYHDRHQAAHYPLYYGEQQDPGRESSYWTVPGSRAGGAPQEYTNWTDQDLAAPASSHFPFILDRHPPQQQDLGEYQLHEARDREWTAAQRAARDYERGFLREGWQKRWEPCSPVRYTRDVSAKRSDNSYRELEAWAARYSHSLPRRRRIEAELRGASQGLSEGSRAPERDSRSGTDPRLAALQQVIQSANRESGLWERASRQQTPNYYQSQTHATDTSHMMDVKERSGYQRRMFSQPPGYIAPPPYSSPHKSSPVLHHTDSSWEQEGKRQSYWSQPTLRKQDISIDHRKGVNEDFTKPDLTPYTFPELEGPKIQRQVTDTLQASSAISSQKPLVQCEGLLSLHEPQVLPAVQNKHIEEPASKVIEGRKFRLNKKTGGMTIFCLVSRIADPTETPSLPLSTLQTNIQNTELGVEDRELTDNGDTNQTHKLADEVDFRASTIPEQLKTPNLRGPEAGETETPTCVEREMLKEDQSERAETDVSPDTQETSDSEAALGRQVAPSVPPVSVKYPLWREPSFTSRAENETSSPCLEATSEEQESAALSNQDSGEEDQPLDREVKSLDAEKDTESEDNKDLLVIDTTCVVVKMELIPSPKKEHVHYVDSPTHTEHSPLDIQSSVPPECVQSSGEMENDGVAVQKAETDLTEIPESELDSELIEKQAPEVESEISFPCLSSPLVSGRETLEERAERILGIPLHDSTTEMPPDEVISAPDSCVEDQDTETSPDKERTVDDEAQDAAEDTTEEEVGQTEAAKCLQTNDAEVKEVNEDGEDLAGNLEALSTISEEHDHDAQLTTDTEVSLKSKIIEDPLLNSAEDGLTQQREENNQPVESDTSPQHSSQCPLTALSSSSSLSPSLDCEDSNSNLSSCDNTSCLLVSETTTEKDPDPELENMTPHPESLALRDTPSQQLASPLPPGSAALSPSCTLHIDRSPSGAPPDLIYPTAEEVLSNEEEETGILQLSNNTTSEDVSDELESQQQSDSAACVKESSMIDEPKTNEPIKDGVDRVIEQPQVSQDDPTDGNILQQHPECIQTETVDSVKDNRTTEEQAPKEVAEDPKYQIETLEISQEGATEVKTLQQQLDSYTIEKQKPQEVSEGPLVEQASQENVTEIVTRANITQHQTDNCPTEVDVSCLEETYLSEEQPQQDTEEGCEGLLELAKSDENVADSKTEAETVTEQQSENPDLPQSLLDCAASPSSLDVLSHSLPDKSHQVATESACLLETDSVSAFSLDADVPETAPPPLHHPAFVESPHVLSSSSSNPPPGLFLSSAPGLPLKEEPQYPKSLWDAVNRIRKHTAPDSENEEEEVSELWDPESIGEDSGGLDAAEDMDIVFNVAGEKEVFIGGSDEDVEVGQIQRDPRNEETSRHAEEDTLSCSSGSSRGSGDTVIVAEDEETGTEDDKTETERGQSCSGVKHEEEEEEEEESVRNESGQNEDVTNTTTEAAETDGKRAKVSVPDEGVIASESLK